MPDSSYLRSSSFALRPSISNGLTAKTYDHRVIGQRRNDLRQWKMFGNSTPALAGCAMKCLDGSIFYVWRSDRIIVVKRLPFDFFCRKAGFLLKGPGGQFKIEDHSIDLFLIALDLIAFLVSNHHSPHDRRRRSRPRH